MSADVVVENLRKNERKQAGLERQVDRSGFLVF